MPLTVEVDGAGAVLVDLLHYAIQVLVCEFVVQLLKDLLQSTGGDVAVA